MMNLNGMISIAMMRSLLFVALITLNLFAEGELDTDSVVRKFRTTAADGKKYLVAHYNIDMIISLGYRVKSAIATRFNLHCLTCNLD